MNSEVISITFWQVLIAYVVIVVVYFMLRSRGLRRERLLFFATIRMTLQLVLVGYLLMVIFDYANPFITAVIVLVMVGFAVFTLFRKFKDDLNRALRKTILMSVPIGTIPIIVFFVWVVIRVEPYYDPQYIIPISGMIVGNSMTGISLGVHTLITRFKEGYDGIEEALVLGATPEVASKSIFNDAFDAALLPTLNSMLGMGIIFLPGMMTGQILSGVDPTLAIMYQLVIMLGILGGVSITTFVFLYFGVRTFFNSQQQLV